MNLQDNLSHTAKSQVSVGSPGNTDCQMVSTHEVDPKQASQETLEKLYKDGIHICHTLFGTFVEGECLFCQGLLKQ